MNNERKDIVKDFIEKLESSSLKSTMQRKSLIKIIFGDGNAHYTVDDVYKKAKQNKIKISLATVYNSLNLFRDLGILKILTTSTDTIFYDTNWRRLSRVHISGS